MNLSTKSLNIKCCQLSFFLKAHYSWIRKCTEKSRIHYFRYDTCTLYVCVFVCVCVCCTCTLFIYFNKNKNGLKNLLKRRLFAVSDMTIVAFCVCLCVCVCACTCAVFIYFSRKQWIWYYQHRLLMYVCMRTSACMSLCVCKHIGVCMECDLSTTEHKEKSKYQNLVQ